MLCERCDNSEATFHLTEISNDIQTELHLCMTCAKRMKFKFQKEDDLSIKQVFSFLDEDDNPEENFCPDCGLSAAEFLMDGRPGCPSCYCHLKTVIIQSPEIPGKIYSGKIPTNYIDVINMQKADSDVKVKTIEKLELAEIEEYLKLAVSEERYEDAAELRDKIHGMRGE
jgi:protein arginine kinase activator